MVFAICKNNISMIKADCQAICKDNKLGYIGIYTYLFLVGFDCVTIFTFILQYCQKYGISLGQAADNVELYLSIKI